jgi:hypothetical protein
MRAGIVSSTCFLAWLRDSVVAMAESLYFKRPARGQTAGCGVEVRRAKVLYETVRVEKRAEQRCRVRACAATFGAVRPSDECELPIE